MKEIDDLICQIKNKIEYGGQGAVDLFIILTFEIARAEIKHEKLTDLTIDALREISARTSHYYYYRDYRSLYDRLQDVYLKISKLDTKFYDADFQIGVYNEIASWTDYISKSSYQLITKLPDTYFTSPKNPSE